MTTQDFKSLLGTVATQATTNVEANELTLVPTIRRRRRRRLIATAATATLTTATVLACAYAALPTPIDNVATAPTTTTAQQFPKVPEQPSVYKCGKTFPTPVATGNKLRFLPSRVALTRTPTGWFSDIKVVVTNDDLPATLANASPHANLVLVRNNKLIAYALITTKERPVELKGNDSHTFAARLHIKACDQNLPAGAYLVYFDHALDSKADGNTTKELRAVARINLD